MKRLISKIIFVIIVFLLFMQINIMAMPQSQDDFSNLLITNHDIFQFKRLSIVYEDSPVGKIYVALDDLKELSEILGYEIIGYTVDEAKDDDDRASYHQEVLEAHKKLAKQVESLI